MFLLFALPISGCAPSQSDVERSIRDEMKSKKGLNITSIDLKKQDDGSFVGTATAENGDVYDVTTKPPKGSQIEWNAVPGPAMVDRIVKAGLEQQLMTKVKTLQLTKNQPGHYTGRAELANGSQVTVTTHMQGADFVWKADPVNP
jgi:hypothetical protein